MSDSVDDFINAALQRTGDMSSYEQEQFLDEMENFAQRSGNRSMLQQVKKQKGKLPALMPNRSRSGNPNVRKAAATFTVTIKRRTVAIASSLPVAVFGNVQSSSGYAGILSLPSGVSLESVVGGRYDGGNTNLEKFAFTFKQGLNIDIIDVSCAEMPYPSFLSSFQSNEIIISAITMDVNGDGFVTQFNNAITPFFNSSFGSSSTNKITPNQFKTIDQQQKDLRELSLSSPVDSQRGLVIPVSDVVVQAIPITISLNCFCSYTQREGM